MSIRFATAAAFLGLITSPAFANCSDELTKLEPAIVSAETGASQSGTTATPHQKEVLSGNQAKLDMEATGSTGQPEAVSPHQQHVMGKGTDKEQASQLMTEARKMGDAGNEDGCMQKLTELKQLLGAD